MNKLKLKLLFNIMNGNKGSLIFFMNKISLFLVLIFILKLINVDFEIIKYQIFPSDNNDYIKKINDISLYYHNLLLIIPMVISVFCIFKNKINSLIIFLSIIFSYITLEYDIVNYIHKNITVFFINNLLLDLGRVIINNQYTKIIIYFVLIFILIFQIFYKKRKSISNIFILIINLSVLITLFVFHLAIPIGFFKHELNLYKNNEISNTKLLKESDLCKIKNCYILKENGDINKISHVENIKKISNYKMEIKNLRSENKDITYKFIPLQGNVFFNYELIIMKKNKNKSYLITIENRDIEKISRESEIIFSFLCITAHGVWIFGGLFLIVFHQRKLERKIK